MSHALDIGCGTGAWVIDFALAHPTTQVTGIDLSAIQPSTHPPNCNFQVEDATKPWNFTQPFDFIHTRAITYGISGWDGLVSQAFAALKPGGWIELQEFCLPMGCDDGSMSEGGKGGAL
jgi:trans-aconitate methyltransferase